MENFLSGCQFHPSFTLVSPRDKYPKNESFRPKSSVSLFCDGNGGITAIFKHCHINEVKHPKYVCWFIDLDPMNTTYNIVQSDSVTYGLDPAQSVGKSGLAGENGGKANSRPKYV